jgi:hypothetical protein
MGTIACVGKQEVNGKHSPKNRADRIWKVLEASPGIEPGCKDLQSSA